MLDKFLMPLNCGLPDGSNAVALTLKPTGTDTFQRTDCEKIRLFPMEAGWQPTGWTLLGRRRICIEHKTDVNWLSLDTQTYLIRFQYPPEVQINSIDAFRARAGELARVRNVENGAETALDSYWDNGFIQMKWGMFISAKFELLTSGSSRIFGVAIRRCDQSLTLQSWSSDTNSNFNNVISSLTLSKPAPADSRTDFTEIIHMDKMRIEIRLRPCGWPAARTKLSSGAKAKAFNVSITLSKPKDTPTESRQESKTWQRLEEKVTELSGEFTEL